MAVEASQSLKIVCAACGAANRVPASRLDELPNCGKCHGPLLASGPIILDDANFDSFISRTELPVVVDFWADWCGPCHAMAPAFQSAAEQLRTRFHFVKVNVDAAQGLAGRYGIRSIPTLVLLRNGKEADRVSGALDPGSLRSWLAQRA
jgi:thioredoxin 2